MATFPMNTPANSPVVIDEVWAKEILENRRNRLVMEQLVNHDYEGQIKNHGDTVHIISLPDMVAQDIVPGTEMTVTPLVPTEQLLVIDQYKGVPAEVQDMLMKQSTYDLRRPYTEKIGFALADAVDKYLIGLALAGVAAGNTLTAVSALNKATLVAAHAKLDALNVPTEGRSLIINGFGKADLRLDQDMSWAERQGAGNSIAGAGYAGVIYDTPVYVTNQVPKINSNANWGFILIHRDALTAAVQIEPEVETDRRVLSKSWIVAGSTLFGGKVIRPDHIVVIPRTV